MCTGGALSGCSWGLILSGTQGQASTDVWILTLTPLLLCAPILFAPQTSSSFHEEEGAPPSETAFPNIPSTAVLSIAILLISNDCFFRFMENHMIFWYMYILYNNKIIALNTAVTSNIHHLFLVKHLQSSRIFKYSWSSTIVTLGCSKIIELGWAVGAHACNPRTQEAEAGRSLWA